MSPLTNAGLTPKDIHSHCKREFSVGSSLLFNKVFVDMGGGDAATTAGLLTSCSGFTIFLLAGQETQT